MKFTRITAPLFVLLPRKTKPPKKQILNLNNYRNWHYIANNQTKQAFKDALRLQLEGKIFTTPIKIEFAYYKPTNRKSDRSNVLSIVEKFLCDAMVEFGCIPDDSDEYIESCHYYGGSIDKENPRVDIAVIEVNP